MKNVVCRFFKFGFQLCVVSRDGKFMYGQIAFGYTNRPVNSFANHQLFFDINYPQRLKGVFPPWKGMKLRKTWGSQLERLANE